MEKRAEKANGKINVYTHIENKRGKEKELEKDLDGYQSWLMGQRPGQRDGDGGDSVGKDHSSHLLCWDMKTKV